MKASPFDIVAETYDEDFTHSNIGQMQRKRVWQVLMPLLQSYQRPLNILEINCGTGEDALQLASLGHNVVATDASDQMIQKATQKISQPTFKSKAPRFLTCSFNQLPKQIFKESFDLVISNFGGLNCVEEKDIVELSKDLSKIMTPEGQLLLVVMGKFCLWEVLYYSLEGKFSKAFRRQQRSAPFQVKDHIMQVFYYGPAHLKSLFRPAFSSLGTRPVGLFIPPSYLETAFAKRPHLLQTLNRWENKFGVPAFSFLADHYCITLKKSR